MTHIDSVLESIPDILTVADALKKQRPSLTEYESIRLAVEIAKADTLETLEEFAEYLDGTHNMFPIPVTIDKD